MSGGERDDRVYLTAEEALSVMAWHDYDEDGTQAVHTYRGGGSIMIGADWTRDQVEDALTRSEAQILGPVARGMGHGVGIIDDVGLVVFATVRERLDEVESAALSRARGGR